MYSVSVIVPVYDSGPFIERCVRSLFGQTLVPVEYVFVDDFSDDGSIDIVKNVLNDYPDRKNSSIFIRNKENSGPSYSRNAGLDAATGKYISFCDSDDWTDPSMLEKMYAAAESADADAVMCDFMMAGDKKMRYSLPDMAGDKTESLRRYIKFPWTVLWCMLYRRSLIEEYRIRFHRGVSYCEDFNVNVKILSMAGTIVNIHEPLYFYNVQNPSSIMHHLDRKRMYDEQRMYMDTIDWLRNAGLYEGVDKEMCWRVLKSSQELVLDSSTYNEFLSLYPQSHRYIWSCPYLNLKLKIMMWCLCHNLSAMSRFMLLIRNLRMRFSC